MYCTRSIPGASDFAAVQLADRSEVTRNAAIAWRTSTSRKTVAGTFITDKQAKDMRNANGTRAINTDLAPVVFAPTHTIPHTLPLPGWVLIQTPTYTLHRPE